MTDHTTTESETEPEPDTDVQRWIRCPECGSQNAGLIDWRPDPDTTLKCGDCGARQAAEYAGDAFAQGVYGDD